ARLRVLDARKRHAVARNEAGRVGQPSVERLGVPGDVRVLERVRIAAEPLRGARLAVPDAGEARPGHVPPGRERMAGRAIAEDLRAGLWIAGGVSGVGGR